MQGVGRTQRRAGARAGLALAWLVLFLAAQGAALAHTHGIEGRCVAWDCGHVHGSDADDEGTAPAAPHDDGPEACALCRVLAAVPGPLSLPAPLPLPEVVREPVCARPVEPARPPVVRDSLARGPPLAAAALTPRAGSRML